MLNTITDLIDISKIESGQVEPNYTSVDAIRQLESMFVLFKPEADKKGLQLTIKTSIETGSLLIKSDREKLDSICSHLISNAIKYTSKGSIEIGCETKGAFIEFYVRDTGIGIEKENQQIVFERFTQVDNSLSKSYDGAGLGLSIAKAYVEMLGGKIWVESSPGDGSVFYFSLPAN